MKSARAHRELWNSAMFMKLTEDINADDNPSQFLNIAEFRDERWW